MFYVSTLLLYNTLQAATPLVDTVVYDRSSVRVATMRSLLPALTARSIQNFCHGKPSLAEHPKLRNPPDSNPGCLGPHVGFNKRNILPLKVEERISRGVFLGSAATQLR